MVTTYPSIIKYRAFAHPQRVAFVFEGKDFSYADYYTASKQAAAYLISLNLKKGDRIGILNLNSPSSANLISGAMLIGVIPVSINWRAMPQEILYIIDDAEIKHFFHGAAFAQLINAMKFNDDVTLHSIEVIDNSETILNTGISENVSADDVCVILYTSGTTGNPKGVMLTYGNFYSCYQLCASDTPSFGPNARNLVCGPLYSIFGFGAFFAGLYAGATNVLIRMFDATIVAKTIVATKVSNALLAPIMMKMISMIDGIENYDFSALKHIQYGGSPISKETLMQAKKLFNCDFTQVYGLTETSGVACALRFDDHIKILEDTEKYSSLLLSAGKPGIGVEIMIVDDEGQQLAANETGEVFIKGENVGQGYWNKNKKFSAGFKKNEWFASGDVGYVNNEGYLFLVDRKNDKIVSKGINIYPAEIEKVLETHPLIKDIAVIGVPDEKAGEAVCAVAVLKKENLELIEFQNWCKGKMSDNKIPKHLDIKTELPRNLTGKVLRRIIREPYWKNEERKIKG